MDHFIFSGTIKSKLSASYLKSNASHLLLLIFWPIYGISFYLVEQRHFNPAEWKVIHTSLDDIIPFNELFIIPYLFWFVFLTGMVLYTAFFNVRAFRKMMYFIMITYTVTIIIYLIFPNYQDLRPTAFARDNIFTQAVKSFYAYDTNTNVCPSIHVLGSIAAMLGGWDTGLFSKKGWKAALLITALLISMSTVFLKQHSIVDVLAAFFLCTIAYIIVYILYEQRKFDKETTRSEKKHEKVSA